ncbi:MAG TPA: YbaB/EbfC family nucleoid-associated protein [Verrucomicrobiota bacterium]|nr:nucleoid-associated protein [Verrucomicrobiales bacterium]HRI16313.1 YbaB/EbfC family nucleoid-associated protein [Verrucomicrobiota bacterium]
MSSIGKLMKQATRMQQQMERVQQELASKTVEGVAGGGSVKVVARCDQTLQSIKIAPEAVNPADVPFLEELVLTAANQALTAAKETANREMGAVTQGMSIPGLI